MLINKMAGLEIHRMTVELKDQNIVMYWLVVCMLTHVLMMGTVLHLVVVMKNTDYQKLLPDQCTA